MIPGAWLLASAVTRPYHDSFSAVPVPAPAPESMIGALAAVPISPTPAPQ